MKVYLINLKRSPDRLQKMQKLLGRYSINFQRFEAVDSREFTDDDLKNVTPPNYLYPYVMQKGEVACFLSHRNCWKDFVQSNDDWALILEDNQILQPAITTYIQDLSWVPKECGLIQLQYSIKPTFSDKNIDIKNNTLLRIKYSNPIGTSAYLISKEVALLAIENSKTIDCPIDNFLFGYWSPFSNKVRAWRLLKPLSRRDNIDTTIGGRGKKIKVFHWEKFSPKRLLLKLYINLHKTLLKKQQQTWPEFK